MPRTARFLTPVTLAAVLLAGCTPSTPMPAPPPTPDATPVFTSDEEALAAAEEAYGKYLALADTILSEGGNDPERLLDAVSRDVYANEAPGFERIANNGWRGTGKTAFTISLQRYDDPQVVAYVCEDVSATDLLDSSGVSVVKPGRLAIVPFEVEFDGGDHMLIVRKDMWDGGGAC
jgi:hypothetical protein